MVYTASTRPERSALYLGQRFAAEPRVDPQ